MTALDPMHTIAYAEILARAPAFPPAELIGFLKEELPPAWLAAYKHMCRGPTNVLAVPVSGFEYMFDYSSELVVTGEVAENEVQEDRVVAAHGISKAPARTRDASRIRGFPSDADRGDRGHFLAHSAGGGLEINLFHQAASLNRGWSTSGKIYRSMERYCARNPGTYFFSRPVYHDQTARPTSVEFGILKSDRTMWIELFTNSGAG
jgi:hypothetical protein